MTSTTTDDKKLSRKVARTEEAEQIEFDKLLDRRGELASQKNEKKVTKILVQGRLESQLQQSFQVKVDKLKFEMAYLEKEIKDCREELREDDIDSEERKIIRNEIIR